MKQKYGVFTLSKQGTGYGNMYVITDASGKTYKSIYHAQDALNVLNTLNKVNPFSKFFGGGNIEYTILPIYEESSGFNFGNFGFPQQQTEPQSQYFQKIEYGVFKIESGSSPTEPYKLLNISGSNATTFSSMSIAYDYIKNIPSTTLKPGGNDFVILPIYKYNKT